MLGGEGTIEEGQMARRVESCMKDIKGVAKTLQVSKQPIKSLQASVSELIEITSATEKENRTSQILQEA